MILQVVDDIALDLFENFVGDAGWPFVLLWEGVSDKLENEAPGPQFAVDEKSSSVIDMHQFPEKRAECFIDEDGVLDDGANGKRGLFGLHCVIL